jgi:5-methylcytosine-specific restriction protein A
VVKRFKESIILKRNPKVRVECLKHYFPNEEHYCCKICNFDFEEKYGERGRGYIEVHHIESHAIKSREVGEYEIDPINDLLPVCSNCHSIIHRSKIPLEIEEIKKIIRNCNITSLSQKS